MGFSRFGRKGASATEYAVLVGLVGAVSIGAVFLLGGSLSERFIKTDTALASASVQSKTKGTTTTSKPSDPPAATWDASDPGTWPDAECTVIQQRGEPYSNPTTLFADENCFIIHGDLKNVFDLAGLRHTDVFVRLRPSIDDSAATTEIRLPSGSRSVVVVEHSNLGIGYQVDFGAGPNTVHVNSNTGILNDGAPHTDATISWQTSAPDNYAILDASGVPGADGATILSGQGNASIMTANVNGAPITR